MPDLFFQEKSISMTAYPIRLHIAEAGNKHPDFYPLHCHEHMEILYFPKGRTDVVIGSDTFSCQKGDAIIVNGSELHSTDRIDHSTIFCIRISQSFFSDINCENVFFKPYIMQDGFVGDCFEKIFSEYKKPTYASDAQIKGLCYLLITHLLRNYKLNDSEALSRKRNLFKINSILQYITANYHQKLTTADLAGKFYLSEYYFCHFFKNETGMSPVSYINKIRIEKAAALLKSSDRSITETAMEVGFDDSNYFSRIFKKQMGMSPREYKKTI